jgi:hypothetical protein
LGGELRLIVSLRTFAAPLGCAKDVNKNRNRQNTPKNKGHHTVEGRGISGGHDDNDIGPSDRNNIHRKTAIFILLTNMGD